MDTAARWVAVWAALLFVTAAVGCGGAGADDTGSDASSSQDASDAGVSPNWARVPESTVVVDGVSAGLLESVEDGGARLLFAGTTSLLEGLAPDDVLVFGISPATPRGLLRKVVSASRSGDGWLVRTTQASVEDAIDDAHFEGRVSLDMLGLEPAELDPSVVIEQEGATARIESLRVTLVDTPLPGGVRVSGTVRFASELDIVLDVSDFQVQLFSIIQSTEFDADLSFSASAGISIDERVQIASIPFGAIVFPVGPVPVVITPMISLQVGADGEVSVEVVSRVHQTASLDAGVRYDGEWHPVDEYTSDFDFDPPAITGDARVRAHLAPQLSILLWGVVGPYADLQGYVEVDATLDAAGVPWWGLYAGLSLGVGVDVEILGFDIAQYELATLIDYRVPLASGVGPDATSWVLETVDAEHENDEGSSVAIGPDGVVHVLHAARDGVLRHSWLEAGVWEREVVDSDRPLTALGRHNALIVDAAGTLHAAWVDFDDATLRYGRRGAAGWSVEDAVLGDANDDAGLALDGDGRPHVVYRSARDRSSVGHAFRDDSGWQTHLVHTAPSTVGAVAAAAGPDGTVHAVLSDSSGDLFHGSWDGSSWTIDEAVGTGRGRVDVASPLGLAFAEDGTALVVYDAYLSSAVRLGSRDPSGVWTFEEIVQDGPATDYPAVAVDAAQRVHVVFCDDEADLVRHARREPSGWVLQTVDPSGRGGRYASAAVAPDGRVHAFYERALDDALRHAVWTAP